MVRVAQPPSAVSSGPPSQPGRLCHTHFILLKCYPQPRSPRLRREMAPVLMGQPTEAGEGWPSLAARTSSAAAGGRPLGGSAFCEGAGVGQRSPWPRAKPFASLRNEARLSRTAEEENSGLPPFQPLRRQARRFAACPPVGAVKTAPDERRGCKRRDGRPQRRPSGLTRANDTWAIPCCPVGAKTPRERAVLGILAAPRVVDSLRDRGL